MAVTPDWTPGPAKWVAVLILGGATVAGLAYSMVRGSTPWRAERAAPVQVMTVESPTTGPERASKGAAKPAVAVKINVNTAAKAELELLPGVGPALADRIIAERGRGLFGRVEDLGRVRGIGAKTIEKLREHVTVE